MKPKSDIEQIHEEAKSQFVRSRKGAHNSGVSSAKPRVITGDEDATSRRIPNRKGKRNKPARMR